MDPLCYPFSSPSLLFQGDKLNFIHIQCFGVSPWWAQSYPRPNQTHNYSEFYFIFILNILRKMDDQGTTQQKFACLDQSKAF